MKKYQIKHYGKDLTFQRVINPDIIKSEISFTETTNAPQGQLNLSLNLDWDNNYFELGDYIKVYVSNKYYPNYQIFFGFIQSIQRKIDKFEEIELSIVGVGALLNNVIYNSSGYTFTKTDKPNLIIESILDYFDTKYPNVITKGTIATFANDVSVAFNYDNCLNAIKKIGDLFQDYYFYIDRNGAFNFKQNPTTYQRVNFKRELQSLQDEKETEITNKLILIYDGGSATYQDNTSITKYGLYEEKIEDSSIKNITTANNFGNSYIAQYSNPKTSTSITINNLFDNGSNEFESIEVGDKIRIQNLKNPITLQVLKKVYYRDTLKIELDKYDNLIALLK